MAGAVDGDQDADGDRTVNPVLSAVDIHAATPGSPLPVPRTPLVHAVTEGSANERRYGNFPTHTHYPEV